MVPKLCQRMGARSTKISRRLDSSDSAFSRCSFADRSRTKRHILSCSFVVTSLRFAAGIVGGTPGGGPAAGPGGGMPG